MEHVFLLLPLFVAVVSGCSDLGPGVRTEFDVDEKKAFYSDAIILGTVVRKTTETKYMDVRGAYGIDVQVKCSYKGPAQHDAIKVIGAGTIPGCPSMEVEVGQTYIFFLKNRSSTEFEIEFTPNEGLLLDELTVVCGLERKFPIGQPSDDHSEECSPVELFGEPCIQFTTTAPPYTIVTDAVTPKQPAGTTPTKEEPNVGPVKPANGNDGKKSGASTTNDNSGAGKSFMSLTISIVAVICSVFLLQ